MRLRITLEVNSMDLLIHSFLNNESFEERTYVVGIILAYRRLALSICSD